MDIIQLLPDHVANQIAAGEVVQRPASVIKELLENAVDAGATSISLLVKDAGKTLVQVTDNGTGMSMTDARMSFERHATSKIRSAEDLFQLHTKGFRGEALASIAAIAQVELKSRQETEEIGTFLKIDGSEVVSQEVCVCSKGTSISVKNLFYNIPARRNFLKSTAVELRHCIDEFQRVAMAHPKTAFSMYHNGNELFLLSAGNYRQRIVGIFGGKTNEKLVPVEEETDLIKISGFAGKPEFAKRTRGEQFFFVNNRFIKSQYLHHAVNSAFDGLLHNKAHPSYFLYLEVNPKSIDINIHPTKTEIKFDDEHALYAILRSSVKHSLGQFSVGPVLDFERNPNLDTPYNYKNKTTQSPSIQVDRDFNPFKDDFSDEPRTTERHVFQKQSAVGWENLYAGLGAGNAENFHSIEVESEVVTGSLFDTTEQEIPTNCFQLQKKYIVSSMKNGMLIIDQHRAHFRVLYEELLKSITDIPAASQQLLFPLQLDFGKRQNELLEQLREPLEQTGFIFSVLETERVEITGIPTSILESEVEDLLEKLIADFYQEIPGVGFEQTNLLAKSIAKSMAVKVGTKLGQAEQLGIVNALFACTEALTDPTNRQTFITIAEEDLAKKFN